MKKVVAVCMAWILSVLSCCTFVSAEEELRLIAEQKSAAPGDTVTISVAVEGNPGFTYMKLGLEYDDALELISVQNGTLIESLTEGRYYVWSAAENQTQDGILVAFTFAVSKKAATGNYSVSVRCYECSDEQERDVAVAVQNGGVSVKAVAARKLGDLDGNGKVNVLDYGMLKSYVMNMFVLTDAQKEVADVNGDGKINVLDYAQVKLCAMGRITLGTL
ncbi:MAG: hypothetical protein E7651_08825 [Ruminococcaceae bacterium]|nr:hypothetical protein [Oscillospiraceae bacterium]